MSEFDEFFIFRDAGYYGRTMILLLHKKDQYAWSLMARLFLKEIIVNGKRSYYKEIADTKKISNFIKYALLNEKFSFKFICKKEGGRFTNQIYKVLEDEEIEYVTTVTFLFYDDEMSIEIYRPLGDELIQNVRLSLENYYRKYLATHRKVTEVFLMEGSKNVDIDGYGLGKLPEQPRNLARLTVLDYLGLGYKKPLRPDLSYLYTQPRLSGFKRERELQ